MAKAKTSWEAYQAEVATVIRELQAVGHDLWSHDYDGQRRELWGWNYGELDGAGFLQIQFDFQGDVTTFWRGEDGVSGVATTSSD